MKEKFSKEQQKRESFSGVSFDFLEKLEVEKSRNSGYLQESVKELKEKLIGYKKMAADMENAIEVARFEINEDKEQVEAVNKIIENYDWGKKNRHNVIIDLLNRISRLSKFKKWRESWGTVGTDFERANIVKWTDDMMEYLESSVKNEDPNI